MTKAAALGVAIGDSAEDHLPSPFRNDVSLAEYMYYARLQREEEQMRASGQSVRSATPESTGKDDSEKGPTALDLDYTHEDGSNSAQFDGLSAVQRRVTMELLKLRNTEWKGVLFLICCDILGPFNAPYAIAQMGLVPGVILYVVMGMTAFWGAMLLLMLFLKLDSARYPLRTYGDLATRLLGPWMGGIAIALQAIQLVINVGIICLSNGQALSQIVTGSGRTMCFSLAVSVTMFLGMITGQIRTLRNVGHFATASVGLNIIICLMCMIGAAKYGPNIEAAQAAFGTDYPWNGAPVIHEAFVNTPLQATLVGLGNAVFAFGGASIFLEILSEMKNPREFWKSALIGQSLILVVYLVMAVTVYSYSGQYSMPAAYLGLNSYGLQTAANAMSIITLSIAALLYGNIGLKVLYKLVIEGALKGPTLSTRKGRMLWSPLIIVYWGLAFVIGSAIPQLGGLTAVLGFVCIGAFSFAFPFQFTLTYFLKRDAQLPEEAFEPGREAVAPVDSWASASRWRRAITTGQVDLTLGLRAKPFLVHGLVPKLVLLVCCLGSYSLAGLGLYGTVLALADSFKSGGVATSFGCAAPS